MQAAAGVGLVAWVVVFAALTEVGTPHTFVAAAVCAGLVCLCPVAGGLVAARITDAASAARVRHVFVVLDGAAVSIMILVCWISFSIEPVGRPDDFAPGVVMMLAVPVVVALVLGVRLNLAVRKVVEAGGPLVPDVGAGAPAQWIRVFGSVRGYTGERKRAVSR